MPTRFILPATDIPGSNLLLVSDIVARTICMGAPMFIYWDVIEAVYGVSVTIKHYNQYPMGIID